VIDTVRLEWSGVDLGEGFEEWRQANHPTARITTSAFSANQPWVGTMFNDPLLGTIGTKQNNKGNYLWVERSLPKHLYRENCRQLTLEEARAALSQLMGDVEAYVVDFLPKSPRSAVQVKRVDFYHQRPMPAAEVFAHISGCLKKQKGVTTHLMGVEVHQSRELHGRFYDKGVESGNEQYIGVVRHEEQVRGAVAKQLLDVQSCAVDPAAVRSLMNKRFVGWPAEVECYGFEQLLRDQGYTGAAAASLLLMPQLEPVFRQVVSKTYFHKCKNLAVEAQRKMCRVDLRVPEGAWVEPGV